jgi:hypothetical protein
MAYALVTIIQYSWKIIFVGLNGFAVGHEFDVA